MTHGRRLIFFVAWLAIADQFVPGLLRAVEHERYERSEVFRFENSDLFSLGPLVSYLRDQPRGERPRVVFFGNSVIWGYGLPASSAVPARFQELEPGVRVFNAAVNGFELGNAYVISKAIIDSVDRVYVQLIGKTANSTLASLIPIDDEDARAFQLRPPGGVQRRLDAIAGTWRLYASNYRLQAALFGTSTRQYVYLHKGDIARRIVSPSYQAPREAVPVDLGMPLDVSAPRAPVAPAAQRRDELRRRYPLLWQFEELVYRHRKRAVFIQISEDDTVNGLGLTDQEIADLTAAFAPFGEAIRLKFPPALRYDPKHLTNAGSYAVAQALVRHAREASAESR